MVQNKGLDFIFSDEGPRDSFKHESDMKMWFYKYGGVDAS